MLAGEQEAFGEEDQFSEEAGKTAERVHIPTGNPMHLAVKNSKWAGGLIGETIYVYTLWILKKDGRRFHGK